MQVEKKNNTILYIFGGIILTGVVALIILFIRGVIGGNGEKECTDDNDCGSGGLCSGENKCSCLQLSIKNSQGKCEQTYNECLVNTEYKGGNINGDGDHTDSYEECRQMCGENPKCIGFSFKKLNKICLLKSNITRSII